MMSSRRLLVCGLSAAMAAAVIGCSSSPDRSVQGSFAVKIGATRPAVLAQSAGTASADPTAGLLAANVTLSGLEARRSDGSWVAVQKGFPGVVDLLALAGGGGAVTLPADLLPEASYTALQVHIAKVDLAPKDRTRTTIAPPGNGWSVIIPADFAVSPAQPTIVDLNVRLDRSFKPVGGAFEFEPEIEVAGVEHR